MWVFFSSLGDFKATDHSGDGCGLEGRGWMYCGWRMVKKFSRKGRNKELKSWAQPIYISFTKQEKKKKSLSMTRTSRGEISVGRW